VTPGREPAPARFAGSRTYAQGRHLRRHDLGLQRRREPLGLGERETELGQADLLVTFKAGELGLGDHARPDFRHQLHPPHQLSCPFSRAADAKYHRAFCLGCWL
jgi:hypothetical protein